MGIVLSRLSDSLKMQMSAVVAKTWKNRRRGGWGGAQFFENHYLFGQKLSGHLDKGGLVIR